MNDTGKSAAPEAAEQEKGGVELRVRITGGKVKARGFVFGKGAEVLLPEQQALALEKAGLAKVIGV